MTLTPAAVVNGVNVCDLLPRDEQGRLPEVADEEPNPPAKAGKARGKK